MSRLVVVILALSTGYVVASAAFPGLMVGQLTVRFPQWIATLYLILLR
jgi:hypothetical protein